MSIVGTQWKLHKLSSCPDHNGQDVTVVENLDASTGRIRVQVDCSQQCFRVRPRNLVSRQDPNIDATIVSAAFAHLKTQTPENRDEHMAAFISRYEGGDFDGALSAAATWSLEQPTPFA